MVCKLDKLLPVARVDNHIVDVEDDVRDPTQHSRHQLYKRFWHRRDSVWGRSVDEGAALRTFALATAGPPSDAHAAESISSRTYRTASPLVKFWELS